MQLPHLLPPQSPEHQGRLTVCLDLDETMICAYKEDAVPPWLRDSDADMDFSRRLVRVRTSDSDSEASMTNLVIYERRGLREFLTRLSLFAEPVVFTAGIKSYARPLCTLLDPHGRIFGSRVLYREATVSVMGHNIKDLSRLGRDLGRVVLVDNCPYSFLSQPSNGVPCLPYHGCRHDNQLLTVILPLVQSLSLFPDVRPILSARFRMAQWLEGKGLLGREA